MCQSKGVFLQEVLAQLITHEEVWGIGRGSHVVDMGRGGRQDMVRGKHQSGLGSCCEGGWGGCGSCARERRLVLGSIEVGGASYILLVGGQVGRIAIVLLSRSIRGRTPSSAG